MDDYRLLNEVDIANAFRCAKLARDQALEACRAAAEARQLAAALRETSESFARPYSRCRRNRLTRWRRAMPASHLAAAWTGPQR